MILNYADNGVGKPVVLLHGMAASLNYWNSYTDELSKTNRVIAMDLMGFGHSPGSSSDYESGTHAEAIRQTLRSLDVTEPIILVGHSMGALIALKFAVSFPEVVSKLVLLCMPVYKNAEEAKQDITKSKRRFRLTLYGPSSHILCTTWCYMLRPISKRLAPFYLWRLPKHIAADTVLHTWRSYSESLRHVIEIQSVEEDLRKLKIPATLVYGTKESGVVLKNLRALETTKNVRIIKIAGTHDLPLEKQEVLSKLI